MRKELQSGIVEFDLLIEKFENGEINFVELTSALWNGGYEEGKNQALISGSVCDCMKNLYTEGIFVKCSKCGKTINIQEQTTH